MLLVIILNRLLKEVENMGVLNILIIIYSDSDEGAARCGAAG